MIEFNTFKLTVNVTLRFWHIINPYIVKEHLNKSYSQADFS